jgi:thermostable 8-oxoguanine DNA glycosylase
VTWKRIEIRTARQAPLKPVLEGLGYRLEPRRDDNYLVVGLPQEVIIKDHYWVRTDDRSAGNAIDFLVDIQGMTFSEAMHLLTS